MNVFVGIALGTAAILFSIGFYNIFTDAPTREERKNRQFRVKQEVKDTIIDALRNACTRVIEVVFLILVCYLLSVIAPDWIPLFSTLFSSGTISL